MIASGRASRLFGVGPLGAPAGVQAATSAANTIPVIRPAVTSFLSSLRSFDGIAEILSTDTVEGQLTKDLGVRDMIVEFRPHETPSSQ